jgi:hypothetical protein
LKTKINFQILDIIKAFCEFDLLHFHQVLPSSPFRGLGSLLIKGSDLFFSVLFLGYPKPMWNEFGQYPNEKGCLE